MPPPASTGRPSAAPDAGPVVAPRDLGPEGLARAEAGGRWGFRDAAGAWVIPPTFAWAEEFAEGLAAVKVDGRWGFVDRRGAPAIAPRYRDADRFSEGLAAVLGERGWSYVDRQGAVRLAGPFEAARAFRCGTAHVKRSRVYHLGSRPHGTYFDDTQMRNADLFYLPPDPHRFDARQALFDTVVAASTEGVNPAIDDVALDALFADTERKAGEALSERPGGEDPESWRAPAPLLEAQWDELAWQAIDATGQIVPPGEAPARAGPAATPAASAPAACDPPLPPVPADLGAKVAALHEQADRMAFFRNLVALGRPAVPALVEALSHPKKRVRLNALEALVRLGRAAEPAVAALTRSLDDRDREVLLFAVWALGRIGPAAAAAVPALLRHHRRSPALVEAALVAIAPSDPGVHALAPKLRKGFSALCAELGGEGDTGSAAASSSQPPARSGG